MYIARTLSKLNLEGLKLRSPLAVIFITVFINMLGYGMITVLIPLLINEQGGSGAIAGVLNSLYAFMQLLSGPVIGALSDRYGRKPVLLVCLSGTAVAFLLLGVANSIIWIIAAVALDGITGGNMTVAYAYIADVTSPDTRARGMGMMGAAFGLGMMIGPAIGGLLSVYSLHLPAFIACFVALAAVGYGVLALPESLPVNLRSMQIDARSLNPIAQLVGLSKLGTINRLLAAMFLLNLAFSGLQTNFPLFALARFGWDAQRIGLFFAFIGVCAVTVQGGLFNLVQPRIGEPRLVLIGLFLMSVGLLLIAATPVALYLYPIVALATLGIGLAIPSLSSLVSTRVSAGQQGRLMGGVQAMLSLALIGGPSLAGLTFDLFGPGAPYAIGSALAFVAFAVAWTDLRVPTTSVKVV